MFHKSDITAIVLTAALIAGAAITSLFNSSVEQEPEFIGDNLTCVILTDGLASKQELVAGYCYYLLEEYAAENGKTISISLCDSVCVDSLSSGSIDLIALPAEYQTGDLAGIICSDYIDGLFCWSVSDKYARGLEEMNQWLNDWLEDGNNYIIRKRFNKVRNPYKSCSEAAYLSPYDDIIKNYAGKIGWDWRMLAAVIYQESHFRIDSKSHRGAAGLMQMMPSTAEVMGSEDIINPEESIKAGSRYLKRLSGQYTEAADSLERIKFTLAAYNAGATRIQDCINYAMHIGVDPTFWDNLVDIIPEMREEDVYSLDTIKLGRFQGTETISYVDAVLDLYERFCIICP